MNSDQNQKKICIVVPCYNEASGITNFVLEIFAVIDRVKGYIFELILVDDGSTDETVNVISSILGDYPSIRLVELTRNFGKEIALSAGLDHADGDAVIFMDADLQHPPDVLPLFIAAWEKGADMVVGRRVSRSTDSFTYRLLANSFYAIHNRLSEVNLPPNVGDFRLIDRCISEHLKSLKERQRFMKGLFSWVGYTPVYVEYEVVSRIEGASKYNKWRSWNLALEGITSFSTVPLRMWTYLGLMLLFLGVTYSVIIIIKAMFLGIDVPGYITLLTAMISFGGVQLIGIGILGEYIGRIYIEVKQRPLYLIKKRLSIK
jgi:polyisoprenyl-phosphate glycosyltransferase